ncbi:type II toxin-antitoxin system VapC family toxin [Conexibacter sp. CPCC 206217]|uniref:type II toxin-antitoxin system VapC family toxin n=1 Tax=Conexibacter sp. CPCC 206217 TaxID=3064574 RepID=UPI002728BD1D|nr:type II toxin-antitoxin system VapC family toxin [Conexibacter sp. CPCC 206217]MDO8208900.1 type II toxin-antitoxin system VapC family toxin [Conexibacter sp. CPCC 206217]
MICLDSSALLTLLHREAESAALADWLAARARTPVVSSALAKVEVTRACQRINPEALPAAKTLLAGLDVIPLSGAVIDEAADVGGTLLRSLDAIHLASALSIRADLTTFIAYDHRLSDAAAAAGLTLATPGVR